MFGWYITCLIQIEDISHVSEHISNYIPVCDHKSHPFYNFNYMHIKQDNLCIDNHFKANAETLYPKFSYIPILDPSQRTKLLWSKSLLGGSMSRITSSGINKVFMILQYTRKSRYVNYTRKHLLVLYDHITY